MNCVKLSLRGGFVQRLRNRLLPNLKYFANDDVRNKIDVEHQETNIALQKTSLWGVKSITYNPSQRPKREVFFLRCSCSPLLAVTFGSLWAKQPHRATFLRACLGLRSRGTLKLKDNCLQIVATVPAAGQQVLHDILFLFNTGQGTC